MSVRRQDDPALYDRVEDNNRLRQYDLLLNCIEIGPSKGIEAFDKYTLWSLNAAVVANIAQFGGRFREEPIYVGDHIPPHFRQVPELVDRFFSMILENWTMVPNHAQRRAREWATRRSSLKRQLPLCVAGTTMHCQQ